jgi:hypothetical protein
MKERKECTGRREERLGIGRGNDELKVKTMKEKDMKQGEEWKRSFKFSVALLALLFVFKGRKPPEKERNICCRTPQTWSFWRGRVDNELLIERECMYLESVTVVFLFLL